MSRLITTPLTISELNRTVAQTLERTFPLIKVQGEISNFARASSGHWYFTLKDVDAQVRCAMFKGRSQWVDFLPRDGDQIIADAQVRLYEARGEYQLIVDVIQRAGLGALLEAFTQRKEKLAALGLFDESRKRCLPRFVSKVGVITSLEAAALRDVVATLASRCPYVEVVVYPTSVQGAGAANQMVQALSTANARAEVDVLILCRGGGSMEDLWAFNDEALAYAIAESNLPVVCGVGHETDITIADFVADVRAPTPTGAAQLVAKPQEEWELFLGSLNHRLVQTMRRFIDTLSMRVDFAARRLVSPRQHWILCEERTRQLADRLERALRARLQREEQRLGHAQNMLAALSPQATLKRGYVIVRSTTDTDAPLITRASQVPPDAWMQLEFHDGQILVRAQHGET